MRIWITCKGVWLFSINRKSQCTQVDQCGNLFSKGRQLDHIPLTEAGLKVIKLFPCSTQLSTKSILLMNVKMPTIVGILTFICMINTTSERLKAVNFFICRYFSFMSSWNFLLSWVEHEKSFITSGPGLKEHMYIKRAVHQSGVLLEPNFCCTSAATEPLKLVVG